ncbi:MAG TPA: DUF1810 domain-containing protein [Flavobacterium sp.]|jgi:uncharacterized protein (DUF1810 family)
MDSNSLKRFLDAQNQMYLKALSEIRNGHKSSHWMWFIFPQIKGLGQSETAKFYGINDLDEASAYLAHPVLGKHLIEISEALLQINEKSATEIFASPDDMKLRSSMTLFANLKDTSPVFEHVLQKYFDGLHDERTLQLLLQKKFANDTI